MIRICDHLNAEHVSVPLRSRDKAGAIDELISKLSANGAITNVEWARRAVWDREFTRSTGIGNGVALPHGKTAGVEQLVLAAGTSRDGVEFESIDQRPAHIVILILSPLSRTSEHIQALARLSRLLSVDVTRRQLISAPDARELCKALERHERQFSMQG